MHDSTYELLQNSSAKQHRTDNQLQSLNSSAEFPSIESKHDIKESEGNMLSPIFKEMSRPETSSEVRGSRTRTTYFQRA